MQADLITSHLGTTSATTISYESYVEMICTFCQTIDHANCKAVQEKNEHKALQAEFQQSRRGGCSCSGHGETQSGRHNSGHGHQTGHGHTGGQYHN